MPAVQPPYRGRFAPSPTGPLHLGSLVAALGSWLFARRAAGEWRVRIEDLDPPREVRGAADLQLRTLAAFGLAADGEILYQSARGDRYRDALQRLLDSGDAFACHCSRRDLLQTHGIHHACRGTRRRARPAIRLRVPPGTVVGFDDAIQPPGRQDVGSDVGDFVLRRADGLWAYQLAVVVDDADQGITQVVRGADLLDSTPRQILLQRRLGLPTPAYAHLPLIVGDDGRKLSKSLRALPVDPADPMPALRTAWALLGQPADALREARTPARFLAGAVPLFAPERIPPARPPLAAAHNMHAIESD